MHVLHVATGLKTGGAETMLQRIVMRSQLQHTIVSLTSTEPVGDALQEAGIPVHALNMAAFSVPAAILRLRAIVRSTQANIVKSWMYHGDLVAALANPRGRPPLIWGVHNTNLDPENVKRTTRWTALTCARLSHVVPAAVVYDSHAAAAVHVAAGYDSQKVIIIANGFDTDVWRPRPEARLKIRRELNLPDDAMLVGLVARFHPVKDHRTFIAAAARIRSEFSDAHFILCGGLGIDQSNVQLMSILHEFGLASSAHILGRRDDLHEVVASLDVSVSSSRAESFPLAVGESMAAGIPSIATDVGDSAYLLGDSAAVVPPANPELLARACLDILHRSLEQRKAIGERQRERIQQLFSIESTVAAYDDLFIRIGDRRRAELVGRGTS